MLFKKVSCQKITSSLTIVDATTSHLFGYPKISNRPPLQIIKNFIHFSLNHGLKRYTFQVYECGELYRLSYLMKLYIDHEGIVKTTSGYAYSFDGKV